ncbi:M20 metallopeptidase family protein [Metabacillus arenae]|uniref:Amidohydrolase n=1 Tax=Metabacillus arenae TaxID=2771434 RepID=A0A926RW95_9BACI|nr:M20 family metallopeptidase [Metabacillus arenae]MBD1378947.1 amidohydrolase [Metabacillus arenae]
MKNDLIHWRRDFHQNPELGFKEVRTSKIIRKELMDMGIKEIRILAKTGIEALIRGKREGSTIMLRADMDALPIQDQKNKAYSSKVDNIAHLCGHDAHTAILLGAARLLMDKPLEAGNVKLVFQPAEEGLAGAKSMIEEGVLKNPEVDAVAALHVQPSLPTGYISVCPNDCTANSDRFDLVITGNGGHAGHPHKSVDSITVASQIISSLQQIVSRQTDPLKPVVLTIGKINGGFARNVIAPFVSIEGTVRTLSEEMRKVVPKKLEQIVKGHCESFGSSYQFTYIEGYPSVKTDSALIPLLMNSSSSILGEGKCKLEKPSMGGEDFAYYTEQVPGIYFRLGTRSEEKGCIYPHHHPMFDIDEEALPIGAALMADYALNFLKENKGQEQGHIMGGKNEKIH